MRKRLTTSVLILSTTLLVGCAPRVAKQGATDGALAKSNWQLPSWKMPSFSKKSESAKPDLFASTRDVPAKTFASKEPSATENISTKFKESKFAKGVESAWSTTKTKFSTLPSAWPKKDETAAATSDPVSLASPTPKVTAQTHISAARLMDSSGQTAKAEEHYRQALAIEPTNIEALLGHAHLLDKQDDLDRAVVLYQVAVKHHPNDARATNDLGLCLARQSRLAESIKALNRAVQLQPQRKLYRNNLATVLTEMKRNDEAFAHLAAVHGVPVAHYNMGFLLNKKGEKQRAAYHFAEAARADPNFVSAQRWADHLMAARPAPAASRYPTTNTAYPGTAATPASAVNAPQPNANPLR